MNGPKKITSTKIFKAGMAKAERRQRGEFDGLFGQLPDGASVLLKDLVTYLRDYLLDRYPPQKVKRLLEEYEPTPGYGNAKPIPPEERLALDLFNSIRSATRCEKDEFAKLIFGPAGARDEKRQAGTRKKRRPEINKWIAKQLERDPKAKSPDLWVNAPEWITDQIGKRRFANRVTEERKARK